MFFYSFSTGQLLDFFRRDLSVVAASRFQTQENNLAEKQLKYEEPSTK
jgi:hypothetical protein